MAGGTGVIFVLLVAFAVALAVTRVRRRMRMRVTVRTWIAVMAAAVVTMLALWADHSR